MSLIEVLGQMGSVISPSFIKLSLPLGVVRLMQFGQILIGSSLVDSMNVSVVDVSCLFKDLSDFREISRVPYTIRVFNLFININSVVMLYQWEDFWYFFKVAIVQSLLLILEIFPKFDNFFTFSHDVSNKVFVLAVLATLEAIKLLRFMIRATTIFTNKYDFMSFSSAVAVISIM